MNNTTNIKLIKKKPKIKANINKTADDGLVAGMVLDQQQKPQSDEKVVKKKRKIKEICENEPVEEHAKQSHQQQCQTEKIKKKKAKVKQFTEIEAPVTVLETGEHQQEKKKNLKVKQSSNKCQDAGTIEMAVEKTKKQQGERIDLKKKVKERTIPPADTVLSQNSPDQQQQDLEYYHRKTYIFMKTLKRDYKRLALIYNSCLKSEQEREQRNEQELDELKRQYNQMQVERTNIKRKRWCRYCESEATYLSTVGLNFYCSQSCEQKQNDLVSAMEGSFKQ